MKGKFIVFYGVNNLGKTTQKDLLIKTLEAQGIDVEYLKYPIYDLEPSGPVINNYLREDNVYQLNQRELQLHYIINRTHYQPTLQQKLNSGIWIVAEDYTGTGIAWGIGGGVDKDYLIRMNNHLIKEDLSLYFYGERFTDGIEKGHKHENDSELTMKVALAHEELANMYNWKRIHANQSKEKVQADIWRHIQETCF